MGSWYRVTKTISGRKYDYWQRTYRVGKSVKTKNKYIGPSDGGARGTAGKTFYHGTLETFDTFSSTKAGSNTEWKNAKFGTFFLDSKERAAEFPELARMPGDKRPVQVKEAQLSLKKPLDLTTQGIFTKAEQAPLIVKILGGEDMAP